MVLSLDMVNSTEIMALSHVMLNAQIRQTYGSLEDKAPTRDSETRVLEFE